MPPVNQPVNGSIQTMRDWIIEKWDDDEWQAKPEKTLIFGEAILLDQSHDDRQFQYNAHYICHYHPKPSCVRSAIISLRLKPAAQDGVPVDFVLAAIVKLNRYHVNRYFTGSLHH